MKKLKRILVGATFFAVMSVLTACGCGNGNGNNAADETPIVEEDNTVIDEKVPEVTEMPEKDRNDKAGVDGEYNGTVEYDTNGVMNDNTTGNDMNGDGNRNNELNNNDNAANNNDSTVTGELGNTAEDLGNGVGNAVEDVGNAVGDMLDGDNDNNNNGNNRN